VRLLERSLEEVAILKKNREKMEVSKQTKVLKLAALQGLELHCMADEKVV
jgi:hypothetical protein